jgi:hypothetical protein
MQEKLMSLVIGGVASNLMLIGDKESTWGHCKWIGLPFSVKNLSEQNVWWNSMELPFWVNWHIKSRFFAKLNTCKTF